jgi:type I restriction enzyme R subunit
LRVSRPTHRPSLPEKRSSLRTDAHADIVVDQLKALWLTSTVSVDDDTVLKITGAADKPLQLIRRFRNEANPKIAVTVDL